MVGDALLHALAFKLDAVELDDVLEEQHQIATFLESVSTELRDLEQFDFWDSVKD